MKKRLLSGLLVLVMLLAMLPVSVLAENGEEQPASTSKITYYFADSDSTITEFSPDRVDASQVHFDVRNNGKVYTDKHFVAWKDSSSEVVYQPGDTVSVAIGTSVALTAQYMDCADTNDDGYCEFSNCTKCFHDKNGTTGYCTDPLCEHDECPTCGGPDKTVPGGSVLPPVGDNDPAPDLPAAPTSLEGFDLSVVVECGHPDHSAPVSYDVLPDTWEDKIQVYYLGAGSAEDPFVYYCSIRVDEDAYISLFDIDAKGIHTNATKGIPSFVLKYVGNDWTIENVGVDNILRIQVECVPDTPAVTTYTIYPEAGKHGTVSSEGWPVYVEEGDDVTFWFYPDKGYEVSAVYLNGMLVNYYGICYDHYWDCDGCEDCWWIDWSQWYECDSYWCDHDDCWYDHYYCDDDWCGHYYPAYAWSDWQDGITIYDVDRDYDLYVEFAPIDDGCPSAYYWDLDTEAWYHEATDFVIENDIMKGVGGKSFDPNGKTTRGQLVTMLYRLAGEPKVSGESEFLDVADGKWYTDAVIWAAKKGIVDGYGNGYFGVNDVVTREQTVTILYRYAKYMGVSVSKLADLSYFIDAEDVSDYAEEPFGWAVKKDIVEGDTVSGGKLKLNPQGATARVEMAAMLMRFAKFAD